MECLVQAGRLMIRPGKSGWGDREVMGMSRKGAKWLSPSGLEKPLSDEVSSPVPQTDTGRQVEQTKANERTLVKELGKMEP